MNTPWYYMFQEPLYDLSNHDNFFLYNQGEQVKIYPALVEVAEHVVSWIENNPEFKNKIINAEYDLIIWDDVSGRPVTLLIKHIINNFRKRERSKMKYW